MKKNEAESVTPVNPDPMDGYHIVEVVTHITGRGGNYMWHKDHHVFTRLEYGELLIEPTEKFGNVDSVLLPPGAWRAELARKPK